MLDRKYYYLDKIARLSEVLSEFGLPDSVAVNDVTLREANQVVSFSFDEKIQVAHALDDVGIHQIQVGVPGVSKVDAKVVQKLKKDNLRARLEAVSFIYRPNWKEDLEACIDSGADSIDMFYPVSEDKLMAKGVSREEAVETCSMAIEYAKSKNVKHVVFCPFPANRIAMADLKEWISLGERAGADMILITDTYGTSSPPAMRYFLKQLKKYSTINLGIHCHNDMGLALANTLAAVEGGANMVDASINGLGDRTGNCCLDEVIIALGAFYNFDLGLNTGKLYELSKMTEAISEIRLPFGKPLVGDNAFVHRHDDDIKSSLEMPSSTVPVDPFLVGNKRRILLGGEYTGPIGVKAKADELGIDLPSEKIEQALIAVRERLRGRKSELTDDEFMSIVGELD